MYIHTFICTYIHICMQCVCNCFIFLYAMLTGRLYLNLPFYIQVRLTFMPVSTLSENANKKQPLTTRTTSAMLPVSTISPTKQKHNTANVCKPLLSMQTV